MAATSHVVVVGHGMVGHRFVEALRSRDAEGRWRITVLAEERDAQEAAKPVVVFEVLSKSTAWYDQTRKLRDYEACPDILHYVCVSQSEVRVSVWLRDAHGRLVPQEDITDLSATLDLPAIGVDLALADIYEGVAPISEPQA